MLLLAGGDSLLADIALGVVRICLILVCGVVFFFTRLHNESSNSTQEKNQKVYLVLPFPFN